MAERLTKHGKTTHENGICCTHFSGEECVKLQGDCSNGCLWEEKVWEKLARYEDLEEAGRLIELPCAVDDTVYEITNNTDSCCVCSEYSDFYGMDSICSRYNIDYPRFKEKPVCEKQYLEIAEYQASVDWIFDNRNNFGKTVFLTREEAEAALKGAEQ